MNRFCGLALAVVAVAMLAVSARASGVIEVSSLEELLKIGRDADYPLNGHYVLTNDIDVSATRNLEEDGETFDGRGWRPIGVSIAGHYRCRVPGNLDGCPSLPNADSMFNSGAFSGTFDGNGRTIRGLYVDRIIPAIQVNDMNSQSQHHLSAGLFGVLRGATVKNLTIEADTIAVHGHFATHSSAAGILAGFSYNSTITNVHTKGTVVGIGRPSVASGALFYLLGAGGLVGIDTWSNITNSGSEVTLSSMMATPLESWWRFPNNKVGGLVGTTEFTTISGSRATTEIQGTGQHAGGLVGENNGGTISRSGAAATGRFLNIAIVGGLVGANNRANGLPCPDCDDNDNVVYPGIIDQCYSTVNLNLSGDIYFTEMGGLVGHDAHSIIENSYSIGTLTYDVPADVDNTMVGGLVGYSRRFWLSNWAESEVSRNNYAAVSISGQAGVSGGLVGVRTPYYDIEEELENFPFMVSYWDADLTPAGGISMRPFGALGGLGAVPGVTAGGNGKTTAEMMRRSTFEGWDFTNIWRINEGESYPYLAWQTAPPMTSISRNTTARGANRNSFAPTVTLRGRTLDVKTSSPANLQVRLVDMRGRTAARFNVTGGTGGNFHLNKTAAGRYIVDMRETETGRRFTSSVVLR
jgi:hypothetical protein